MRTPLVLGLALLSFPAAAADPIAFFADGAGSVSIDGVVEVPMLRGVDTQGRPAVLATGPKSGDEDPDEFLLTIALSEGPNKCTEAVVGKLGGWVQDKTIARSGSFLGKVTKTATKAAYIPEVHIGDLVVKDVHCEVDKSVNSLAVPQVEELAVAVLPSKGVVQFVASDGAATLLDAVGNTHAAVPGQPMSTWAHGRKSVTLGKILFATVTLFGKPATVALDLDRTTSQVARDFEGITWTTQRSGLLYTAGGVQIGGKHLADTEYIVYDGIIAEIFSGDDSIMVDAVLGLDALFGADIAVDPRGKKIAISVASDVKWTDPSEMFLEKDKEKFDKAGSGSTSLLLPLPESTYALAQLDAEACVTHLITPTPNKANAAGVRTLGASKVTIEAVPCDVGVARAAEDDGAASAEGGESDSGASKEATRHADWGDALWKRGRYADAYAAYTIALDKAEDDCSYPLDYAEKSFQMGEVDKAYTASTEAAELYDAWASLPLATRLEQGDSEAQDDSCHRAFGLRAASLLARESHSKVEGIFDEHMDLDEDLALVAALSRLSVGRPDKAHGPLLQALNVGGRGDTAIHVTLGLTGARMDRDRIAEASIDRLFALEGGWALEDALAAAAVAHEIGGNARAKAFTERLVKEYPGSAVAWAVYGLEAHRRGDAGAIGKATAKAGLADASIDLGWGSSDALAAAAALRAVTGDAPGAARDLELAGNAAGVSRSLYAAKAVVAAATGDSTALDAELQEMARRAPMHPLGTLKLLSAVPRQASAPE